MLNPCGLVGQWIAATVMLATAAIASVRLSHVSVPDCRIQQQRMTQQSVRDTEWRGPPTSETPPYAVSVPAPNDAPPSQRQPDRQRRRGGPRRGTAGPQLLPGGTGHRTSRECVPRSQFVPPQRRRGIRGSADGGARDIGRGCRQAACWADVTFQVCVWEGGKGSSEAG
jgi:hypothetical protein